MTPIIATIVGTLGSMAVKMLMQLLTEDFLKHVVLAGLQKVADSTESDLDNELVASARKAWLPEESPKND